MDFDERGIEGSFVAAKVILIADAAGRDVDQIASLDIRAAGFLANTQARLDRDLFYFRDFLDQVARHGTGKVQQGVLLLALSGGVNDHHGFSTLGLVTQVSERRIGGNHHNDFETVEANAVPFPLADGPNHHAFLAGKPHFRIREARAGVDIAGANLEVVTRNRLRVGDGKGEQHGRRQS